MQLNLQAIKPTSMMTGAFVFSAEPELPLKKIVTFVNAINVMLFSKLPVLPLCYLVQRIFAFQFFFPSECVKKKSYRERLNNIFFSYHKLSKLFFSERNETNFICCWVMVMCLQVSYFSL